MKEAFILIVIVTQALSQCDFIEYSNKLLSGSFGPIQTTLDDAKKTCLLNRPTCTGIVKSGSSYSMTTGFISDSTVTSSATSWYWDCPTGFPYYVLQSSYCEEQGYSDLGSVSCEAAIENTWIIFLLAPENGFPGGLSPVNNAAAPHGCIYDTDFFNEWYYNSYNSKKSAGADYTLLCYAPPTPYPTLSPTDKPSSQPTFGPTPKPTKKPTRAPTQWPSFAPTKKTNRFTIIISND